MCGSSVRTCASRRWFLHSQKRHAFALSGPKGPSRFCGLITGALGERPRGQSLPAQPSRHFARLRCATV
jgi:hypothetical protein